jgi:hypothetical protein
MRYDRGVPIDMALTRPFAIAVLVLGTFLLLDAKGGYF